MVDDSNSVVANSRGVNLLSGTFFFSGVSFSPWGWILEPGLVENGDMEAANDGYTRSYTFATLGRGKPELEAFACSGAFLKN